jgi:UDP-N-acetylmuramate--alanine ligase
VAVFQPHRYTRLSHLMKMFATSFNQADIVIVTEVYAAGEAPIPGVSGKTVLDALLRKHPRAQVTYLPHRTDVVPYLTSRLRAGDLVLTMGAGDVTAIGPELVSALQTSENRDVVPCQ